MTGGRAPQGPRSSSPTLRTASALLLVALLGAGCTGTGGDADRQAAATTATHRGVADIRPDQLLGLDGDRLTATLGPADFRRADGPAEIWQYRDGTCVLDLFLYADPAAGGLRVEHVDVRDRSATPVSGGSDCATALLRQRQLRATSG